MLKTRNLRKQAKPVCVFLQKAKLFSWLLSDCFPALLAIAFTGRVKCLSNAPGGGSDLNRAIVLHYHLVSRTKASTSSQGSIWQYQQWLDSVWNWNGVLPFVQHANEGTWHSPASNWSAQINGIYLAVDGNIVWNWLGGYLDIYSSHFLQLLSTAVN